jgi:hypothetical protein
MPSARETILSALHAALQTQAAPVLRGEVLPERVPAAGLLILRDGDPGEPAVTLSPLRYHYQHRAEVEAVVQAGTGRDGVFDVLAAGIGTALAADRTLGGLCDWADLGGDRRLGFGPAQRRLHLLARQRRRARRLDLRHPYLAQHPAGDGDGLLWPLRLDRSACDHPE